MINKSAKEPPLGIKLIFLVATMVGCALLGSALLLGVAYLGGMDLSEDMDVFNAVTDTALRPYIKAGIGLNHLAMFSLSAVLFAYWIKRGAWKSYFEALSVDFDLLFKFVGVLFLAYPLIGVSALALEQIDLPQWMNSMDEDSIDSLMKMLQMDGVGDLIVNLIIIALIPAIGEELLFRGVIQREIIKKMKNPHLAIFLASAIFSGFHMQIQGFLPKLIIGLVLGYAYYWTKSIWYPMVIHFVNNGLQTVLLFFVGDQLEATQETAEEPNILVLFIGVIISCFLCYRLVKHIKEQIDKKNIEYT
ncbi:MAG: membrane protease YdiL (CAAX protease family) [Saprospiraceae bacterium]|jgi:membrane protease YdiL (CAAX protease family)